MTMMAWTFAARLIDEVARLARCLGKHRYIREIDHRVHFTVDLALRDLTPFKPHAARIEALLKSTPDLDPRSRDPRLWRSADVEEVISILTAFWGPGDEHIARREQLVEIFHSYELPIGEHAPFDSDPEEPPFPELVEMNWVLLPVDQLDTEHHAGVLTALEDDTEGDEYHPSEPIYQEAPSISIVELCEGAPLGILEEDFFVWSDGPYAYANYVFKGVSKAAKLAEPPISPRQWEAAIDEAEEIEESPANG
ncbi:MAG: hypothetical protein U0271_29845 [Polyangiaceae bacterium]